MTDARESGQGRVEWRKGGRIGEFTLVGKLGQGTMGVVYLCEHVETRARYALKALSSKASSTLVKRFEREGQAQATVDSHPNVLRVHSAGQAGGYRYLVMDLAEGGDLERRLRKGGAMAPLEAARLVAQLAEGLAHVHSCGVLHRDLKPSNVLFDGDGVPKLVDFGLATLEGSEGLTRAGDLIGTPIYMAPEQAAGRKRDVDARSDVYGLGAILYHALTGQRPFKGDTTHEVVKRVLKESPPKPRSLVPGLPVALEAICLKAMAKDPAERFESAAELRDTLNRFVANPDAGPRGPRGLLLAVSAVGAVAVVGLLAVALSATPDPGARAKAPPVAASKSKDAPSDSDDEGVLRWNLRKGSIARCSFEHTVDVTQPASEEVRWEQSGFKSFTRIGWTWKILESSEALLAVEATIHELVVRRESGWGNVDFDSTSSQIDNPYARAVGMAIQIRIDPVSGEVLAVEGTEAIQQAVDRGVIELNREMHWMFYRVPQFEASAAMRNTLNQVFFILPGTGLRPTGSWVQRESIQALPPPREEPDSGRHRQSRGRRAGTMARVMGLAKPEDSLSRTFHAKRDGDGLRITWTADGDRRTLNGEAQFEHGRPRRIELNERQVRRSMWGPGRRILTTKQVFKLKGRS